MRMMPSGLGCGLGSDAFFLQVQVETGFWHLGQIRPVSVEYTRLASDMITFRLKGSVPG
jgi:hypothetical protein